MVLVEGRMRGWGRAEEVVKLLDNDDIQASTDEICNVVNTTDRLTRVRSMLQQDCCICFDPFPPSQVRLSSSVYQINAALLLNLQRVCCQ